MLTTPTSGAGRTPADVEREPEAQAWIAWRQSQGWEYLGTLIDPFSADLTATAEKLRKRLSLVCLDHVMGVAMVFEEPNQLEILPVKPPKPPASDTKPKRRKS